MSKYGSALTIGAAAELDKERVIYALNGMLVVGEDEHGFVYDAATKAECDSFVLGVIDNLVYQCKELAACGRAMERILQEHFGSPAGYMNRFIEYHAEESEKFQDYLYEHEKADLKDEIKRIERES